jgi:excinuclease UvrABC helicase subunit UvrB
MPKKKITPEDLKKAIEDAYALGYKHASQGKKVLGALTPEKEAELQIFALNKSIGENSKQINKEILDKHRNMVNKHMKEWSKDATKALDEIIKDVHKHHGKEE